MVTVLYCICQIINTKSKERVPDQGYKSLGQTKFEIANDQRFYSSFNNSVDLLHVKEVIHNSCHCDVIDKPKQEYIDYRNTHWQAYKDHSNEIIIYSAIYDDRPDTGILPVVRMLGVSKSIQGNVFCQVWYPTFEKPYITKLASISTGRGDTFEGMLYKQSLFTCQLPGSYPLPSHVSIVSNKCQTSTVYLPVYLPVRSSWQHEFGICVAITFEKMDTDQFVEWVELNRYLGVAEINIYNATISQKYDSLLKYYQDQGLVVVHQMPPPVNMFTKSGAKMGSPASLNDCMLKNMYRYRYMIVIDFDEIIVPKMHVNYTTMLSYIDRIYKIKEPFMSYTFRNAYFWSHFPSDTSQPKHLRTLQYKTRLDYSPYMFGPKSFIDPRRCLSVFNHYCWIKFSNAPKRWTIDVDPKIAASHHYKNCNFSRKRCDEMAQKHQTDTAIVAFKDVLIKQTHIARHALHLL